MLTMLSSEDDSFGVCSRMERSAIRDMHQSGRHPRIARSLVSGAHSRDPVASSGLRACGYADLRTALSTSVLPSDQIAPGTLWLAAMTSSNDFSIPLQSSSVITSGGSSLMVWLPWPETCVRIL